MVRDILEKLLARENLTAVEAREAFRLFFAPETTPAQQAALLVAWRAKGETALELAEAAAVLRELALPVPLAHPRTLDTCGTGGDGKGTLNLSTGAALVAAAAGVPVAKHGNRSVSSRCGSADLLEAWGWPLSLSPAALGQLLEELGFAFLFAPALHPAMARVAPVRRELGIRSLFNLLGPLANPAGVRRQIVGVARPELLELVAEALAQLGAERAWVVHGADGLDEISPQAPSHVVEVAGGEVVRRFTVEPQELGVKGGGPGLEGGTAEENARRVEAILQGKEFSAGSEGVALQAAAALVVAEDAEDLREGLQRARGVLATGRAGELLEAVVRRARELA